MADVASIPSEVWNKYLRFEADTGNFWWLIRPSPRARLDVPAGSIKQDGYVYIGFRGFVFAAHRLAFFLTHGRGPRGEVDHINGIRIDNRPENLREADRTLNSRNIRKPMAHNTSGYLGVMKIGRWWVARIKVNGKTHQFGRFDTPEEASAVYFREKRRLHPGCALQHI